MFTGSAGEVTVLLISCPLLLRMQVRSLQQAIIMHARPLIRGRSSPQRLSFLSSPVIFRLHAVLMLLAAG